MKNITPKIYLGSVAALVVCISILNYFAYQFHWYWKFWWFDMIMHTLGGVFVGSFSLWYYFLRKYSASQAPVLQKSFVLLVSLASIAVVGVGWELFEFSIDKFVAFSRHDPVDTASDLFFDVVGSIIAVFIFFLVYNKDKQIEK